VGWILKAEGQLPGTPDISVSKIEQARLEAELCDRLREILSDPRYGTVAATFSGDEILGWPRSDA
jgi:hypothetical protein